MLPETEAETGGERQGTRIYTDYFILTLDLCLELAVLRYKYPFRQIHPQAIYIITGKTGQEEIRVERKRTLQILRKK